MRPLVAIALCGTLFASREVQRPSLRDLLRSAGTYSEQYHDAFTAIVAEEHYRQRSAGATGETKGGEERLLRSDVMLVPGGAGERMWFFFRDVFEVDGKPVTDRRGRLESWYQESRDSFVRKARALALEQARFNLGDILRTVNAPLFALEFLLPHNQDRFKFRMAGGGVVDGANAVTVTYQERRHPTMINTLEGKDVAARGAFWIDPAMGRVLRSELRTGEGNRQIRAVITVTYAANERLQMLVPVSMEETYAFKSIHITGTATYSNFRRFETEARIIR